MKLKVQLFIAAFLILIVGKAWAVTDADALSLLATIDKNEIQAADLVPQNASDPVIGEYAAMMKKDHTQNLDMTQKLASKQGLILADTSAVKELKDKAAQELKDLEALQGKKFDSAYITAMVKGHTQALDMIDNQLLPSVQGEEVKKHLAETRERVNMHLQRAKEIQATL